MRRIERARRWGKWGGTLLCAMLASLYAVGRDRFVCWVTRWGGAAGTAHGVAGVFIRVDDDYRLWPEPGLEHRREVRPTQWWFGAQRGPDFHSVYVPVWFLVVTAAFPTALLWWRDRRVPPGHCTACGYDVHGLRGGVCPEYGAPTRRGPGTET